MLRDSVSDRADKNECFTAATAWGKKVGEMTETNMETQQSALPEWWYKFRATLIICL